MVLESCDSGNAYGFKELYYFKWQNQKNKKIFKGHQITILKISYFFKNNLNFSIFKLADTERKC